MPFKTPPPTFDAELVERIEDYLELDRWTTPIYSDVRNKGTDYEVTCTLYAGREKKSYPRPMFDLLHPTLSFSGSAARYSDITPCDCYQFQYSPRCTDHPELPWDDTARSWERPGQPLAAPTLPQGFAGILRQTPLYSGPRGDYTATPADNIEVHSETGQFFVYGTEGDDGFRLGIDPAC